ncbi:glycerophosphocholine phosphodiesterase GPCPD1 isoform X1 [Microcaecilia unicolor]|uniref:Glycerophosphocholine phosphodiesterase GPCPD1 isoform X1 n=1 Tax=Microcaecilia unicolor TaxID=1415580 RepID=A0A6P7XP58_9AMPH|nr:glycerophosphocholine phosphodiesterase GPCPD1 isoform X1 [Microcaecilia unicolor]XP_030052159.1 glycerophosphocholine phosphodiesterase GPCPD1 isoform X1 [Microcaecilia unicolor]
MTPSEVTFQVRGTTLPGEVLAVCGSCDSLGDWKPQKAVVLKPDADDCTLWKATIMLTRGVLVQYRYFKGLFLEPKTASDPCQVIVHKWETHLRPRSVKPLEYKCLRNDGQFGNHDGVETVDSGWLTCQTEIRLRLHYSEKQPVSISKKKFKKSRFRVRLTLEGREEEEEEDDDQNKISPLLPKMSTTLEISLVSDDEFKSRHSQPECGYALQPDRWTEYSIHTMEPDNLELIFDFFEEDLSETVVQGDTLQGHVGTACLLSSTIAENGKSSGILTLPIMSRNSRQTIGKVRVDYLIIKPIEGCECDMKLSFSKYWRPRVPLDVGHRGAGNSTTTANLSKVRENTVASLKNAASHGAAYVEFDVQISKDLVPLIYHDLTCCISMKKKHDAESLELFEIPVKELTYNQLQLLKVRKTQIKKNETELKARRKKRKQEDIHQKEGERETENKKGMATELDHRIRKNKEKLSQKIKPEMTKLTHVTALKLKDHPLSVTEDEISPSDNCPFPSLQVVLEALPEDVGFNIEIKWLSQQRDGIWDGNLSTYFDMNRYLDIILKTILQNAGKRRIIISSFDADVCTMVRRKQNKYPVLFLTQGKSDAYPELMDLRSRSTPIAMSFAQFEDLLGINVHTEDLLRHPQYIKETKSKGLVIFCWGDDTNDPENRHKLRGYGIDGLIYDRIYDWNPEQPNIFQVEQMERLKKELPTEMLRKCLCPINQFVCGSAFCMRSNAAVGAYGIDQQQQV